MPIEVISLETFSSVSKTDINSTTPSCQRHAVFHSFLSEDRKQDAATTTSNSKSLISFLKDYKVLTTSLIKIWEKMMVVPNNTYVPLQYTLFKLCLSVTTSELIEG